MWNVGDKFKRVRPHAVTSFPTGKVFTVRMVNLHTVRCEEEHIHEFKNIVKVLPTADLLSQAEAEVARLKERLKAESEPKVGDVWVSSRGVSARVVHIEGDMIFCVVETVTSSGSVFSPVGNLIGYFTTYYTKKVTHHD